MKKNNSIDLRVSAVITGCCVVALVLGLAWAATPPSGSLTNAGDVVTWTGGPFTSVNATPDSCVEGVSCDIFTLNLTIAPNQEATVDFRIDWTNNLNDFDLFIYDSDGNEVDNSGAGSTEFEQVTIAGLGAGTYQVVTNAFSTVNASYSGRAELLSVAEIPPDPPLELDNTIRFRNTIVDFSAVSGEPFIRTDNLSDTYVSVPFGFSTTHSLLWKSIDETRSYISLGSPVTRDAVAGLGGGDTHQDFDANNFLYYVDLSAVCVTAAVSTDGGNTFDPQRNNQVTCVSEENPSAAGDDRQWVAAFGDGIAYATWRNLTFGTFWMFKTADGGLTWDNGTALGTVTQSGPVQTDKTLRTVNIGGVDRDAILAYQIFYRGNDVRVFRITDFNDGVTPIQVDDLLVADREQSVGNVFPILSVDTAGNLYAVWSEGATQIFMTTSTDRGDTWSNPVKVGNTFGTNIMPWVKAGDPGRVAVVWYRSPLKGNPNVPESVWDIYMAQSLNALDPLPTFTTHTVNHTTIHFAQICLNGLGCNLSFPMGDRSFLEFPSIDVDSDGAAVITYNDNTNQVAAPYVMVAKQLNGPSLYESVGTIDDTDPGTVTIDQPMDGQVVTDPTLEAGGTHSLPPANFDSDELGDANFPDHGPVIGESIDALDIRCVTVDDDEDEIIVTMEVADLTLPALAAAPAQSGGDGVLFLTQWDYNHDVFWLAAEVRGGVPVFHTGSLGVVSSGTSDKFITYNPNAADSLQVQGTIENTAPGSIELRIPRSLVGNPADGDVLYHITGYAMSQRGPLVPVQSGEAGEEGVPNPSSFPIKVDASGGFTYTVGDGPQFDGVVELSLDDLAFNAPFAPDALEACDPQWTTTLDVTGLSAGQHTLCARQIIDGRDPSPAACVTFVIPEGGDGGEDGAKTTGGGWLASVSGSKINFGFNAHEDLKGNLQLNDHGSGVKIKIDTVTSLQPLTTMCGPILPGDNRMEFEGTGSFNGGAASFRVCVADNGEPGKGVDEFYLECSSGCSYDTAGQTLDSVIDGGNIQVHTLGESAGAAGASTIILDPLLLSTASAGPQLFYAQVYDGNQEAVANAAVTLTQVGDDGSVETLDALTDLTGVAVFSVTQLSGTVEYKATSGAAESNTVIVTVQ